MHALNSCSAMTAVLSNARVGNLKAVTIFSIVDSIRAVVVSHSYSYFSGVVAKRRARWRKT